MMVGHAMLAFFLVAAAGRWWGIAPRRALQAGVVAAVLALVPDVDMVYALVGLAAVDPTAAFASGGVAGVFDLTSAFWGASTTVHRSATHSLVLAVPVAGAVALWVAGRASSRALALATVAGLSALAWAATGPLDGAVVGLFGLAAVLVGEGVRRRTDLTPGTAFVVALVAVGSHPFGDVFTGEPPQLLYPLGIEVLSERVALSADPTLHLLGAFGLELAVIWVAAITYFRLSGDSPRRLVNPRATLAVGYGLAALVLHPPTLETSYHFVFTILAVGLLLAIPELGTPRPERLRKAVRNRTVDADRPLALFLTGVTAVSIGWLAYLSAYLIG